MISRFTTALIVQRTNVFSLAGTTRFRDILIAFLRRHRKVALAIPTEPLVTTTSTAGDVGVIATEAAAHQRVLRTAQLQSLSRWLSARMLERNTRKTRADTCIITATGKQYIDVAIENPAAASYLPKSTVDALGFAVRPEAGTSLAVEIRTMEKFRRYCPSLARMQLRTSTAVSPSLWTLQGTARTSRCGFF